MVKKKPYQPISGSLLLATFQSAFINAATAQYAKNEATRSEEAVVSELQSLSGQPYLNLGGISPIRQNDIGRASVNAHVMKVQADQLAQLNQQQLYAMQDDVIKQYVGKKVSITALEASESPFDTVWFNDQTGYRSNQNTKKQIRGRLQEISLEKNLLIIKPAAFMRMLNGDLTAYIVYVIDPLTAQPAVRIDIL